MGGCAGERHVYVVNRQLCCGKTSPFSLLSLIVLPVAANQMLRKLPQKAQFEVIARNEYAKSELKNPVDCSLFYLALKKKTVLQGLWRMASWNREQGATQRLLANNFDEPKWKTTALKNAYALMSKRRFGTLSFPFLSFLFSFSVLLFPFALLPFSSTPF